LTRVRAVILCWRAADKALEAARSVLGGHDVSVDLVVVDNASGDGSADALRDALGSDHVLETDENYGYSGGMNTGIRHLLDGSYDPVLLLTQDTTLAPGALDKMLDAASRADAGIAGPAVYYGDRAGGVLSAGFRFAPWRSALRPIRALPSDRPYPVDAVDGCCMLIRPEILKEVRFDTRYFMYMEEMDFCHRAHQLGWDIVVVPDAEARHEKDDVPRFQYFAYMGRNRYLFWRENFGIGAVRVSLALAWETAKLVAGLARGVLWPPHWPDIGRRARWCARQVHGVVLGTLRHLRSEYGRIDGDDRPAAKADRARGTLDRTGTGASDTAPGDGGTRR